jgi:hypothetical protein
MQENAVWIILDGLFVVAVSATMAWIFFTDTVAGHSWWDEKEKSETPHIVPVASWLFVVLFAAVIAAHLVIPGKDQDNEVKMFFAFLGISAATFGLTRIALAVYSRRKGGPLAPPNEED